MTKTLTEQWREGTLSMGYYYVSTPPSYGGEAIKYLDDDCSFGLGEDIIQEVLDPVPTYEDFLIHRDYCKDHQKLLVENMNLKKQLEIATKALKEINEKYRFTVAQEVVYKALEEINEV